MIYLEFEPSNQMLSHVLLLHCYLQIEEVNSSVLVNVLNHVLCQVCRFLSLRAAGLRAGPTPLVGARPCLVAQCHVEAPHRVTCLLVNGTH